MSTVTSSPIGETAAPLDALLVGATLGGNRRFRPDASTARWACSLAAHPRRTTRRLTALGVEAVRIAAGTSETTPSRRDRRFADPAWSTNPVLRRVAQGYLATARSVEGLVADADLGPRDRARVEFLIDNLLEAAAPSNLPLVNPASAKEAIDTGGMSLVRGARMLAKDLSSAPRVPEMVDESGFAIGENIATTTGVVVYRSEVLELIRYAPQTAEVQEVPVLLVPPTINKFYVLDLAPGRSLIEHSLREGRQMFVISWRNPDVRHAAWGFDTYVSAILEALAVVEELTGSDRSILAGICSGGILASITAAYLAGIGEQERLAALALAVTVIDTENAGTTSALADPRLLELAKQRSARQGYLDGRNLAEVFAWLRPSDLIWNYWVNNYLLGRRPPAFDILYWNADTTRMTAGLHADFIDLSAQNSLLKASGITVLGVPIDLGAITVDAYVVAGIADHITPWENCYRTTQLLGGTTRFVLSTSGHVAALVNPPGNPKASYHTNGTVNPAQAQTWLQESETHAGSWWSDVSTWLDERCGARRPAPEHLDSLRRPALAEAPGTYVFDK